jgi:hypothetical protein
MRYWNVFPEPELKACILEQDGLVTVKMDATDLRPEQVLRVAQHLLEAAGASPQEAVLAIGGITIGRHSRAWMEE